MKFFGNIMRSSSISWLEYPTVAFHQANFSMSESKYRIQVAAELTGLTAPQLRVWEKRYGIPKPRRSDSRYRLYSDEDLVELREMARLVSTGLAPSEAARRVKDARSPSFATLSIGTSGSRVTLAAMRRAVENYDSKALAEQLALMIRTFSVDQSWNEIIKPLLAGIGESWADGKLNPAQEHIASMGVRYTLQTMLKLVTPKVPRGRCILACVQGERHDLPLLGLAVELALRGWDSLVIGADVPPSAVGSAITGEFTAVGLSLTMPLAEDVPPTLWAQYRKVCGRVPMVLGGRCAPRYQHVFESLGGIVVSSAAQCADVLDDLKRQTA